MNFHKNSRKTLKNDRIRVIYTAQLSKKPQIIYQEKPQHQKCFQNPQIGINDKMKILRKRPEEALNSNHAEICTDKLHNFLSFKDFAFQETQMSFKNEKKTKFVNPNKKLKNLRNPSIDVLENQHIGFKRVKIQEQRVNTQTKINDLTFFKLEQKRASNLFPMPKKDPLKKRNKEKTNSSWVDKNLSNLRTLFNRIFLFQDILKSDVNNLTPKERHFLNGFIKWRNYEEGPLILRKLTNSCFDKDSWMLVNRTKRKEEYLKCGFKFLIKFLQFREQKSYRTSYENDKLRFYYDNFAHLEFDQLNKNIDFSQNSSQSLQTKIWTKLEKYIVPGMGGKPDNSKFKTINKNFLRIFCKSREFIAKLIELNINVIAFLGYSWQIDWAQMLEDDLDEMDQQGMAMISDVRNDNMEEISKLFKTWRNVVRKEMPKGQKQDVANVILESVKNNRYSFPWSFKEIQNSFIFSCLSVVETIQFDYLPEDAESKLVLFKIIYI
jgi:hypothetical protein